MWADLDQAYLEIFGTHPDAAQLPSPAVYRPADEDSTDSGGQVREDE
jgi:hypothetical protein